MRLTTFSDYALRVLMYAAAEAPRLITIDETAAIYNISRAHLMKVVNLLTKAGYLRGVRGRSGGFTLAKQPEDINLGRVIRVTEPDFALVECFSPGNECVLSNCCRLPGLLNDALGAFVAVFDQHTLADIDVGRARFAVSNTIKLKRRGPTSLTQTA
ncbi:RrF2 family transcriptional regulator [Oricola nitratireducens]|uniref:RrF2 family transcriptional regulator n=1 Tax=Oricola nitratireducens TaxID=2775868 RepID=UPI0018692AFA|nr:Rrf2 family transcriptional regulator [Oricola nitratireducens]